jgi:hypothetical protein
MTDESGTTGFWELKPSQLAHECTLIADGGSPAADSKLRTEAAQLAAEWQDALKLPQDAFGDEARRAEQLAALRTRTIEILVKMARNE